MKSSASPRPLRCPTCTSDNELLIMDGTHCQKVPDRWHREAREKFESEMGVDNSQKVDPVRIAAELLCDELDRILWSGEPRKWPEIRNLRNKVRQALTTASHTDPADVPVLENITQAALALFKSGIGKEYKYLVLRDTPGREHGEGGSYSPMGLASSLRDSLRDILKTKNECGGAGCCCKAPRKLKPSWNQP